jgi:glycosyltransferase involved in cell wall biosynthesis
MGTQQMDISVIICTRNRAASLDRALRSAALLRVPEGLAWELIVVDNGSSDNTPGVVAAFVDRLPIRHVFEPLAGLSHARNRGVAEAKGALICWTDDDVELDPEWLIAYHEAARAFPDAAFFGGNVTPVLEGPTPAWFAKMVAEPGLQPLMASRSFETPVRLSLTGGLLPYGANFAVRSDWQRRYHYDPALGVSPSHRRSGEETALILAIIADGGTGSAVPASQVRHLIPASRQTRDYIWCYYRSIGETWALLADRKANPNFLGPPIERGRRLFGVPIWVGRKAATSLCKSALYRSLGRDPDWLRTTRTAAYFWGATAYWSKPRAAAP